MGNPPRRDAIHRVSPARGAAPLRHSPRAVGQPGDKKRDKSRLYVGARPAAIRAGHRAQTGNRQRVRPFQTKNVSLQPSTGTCGEIGRRARLRIWWLRPCRFESYQVHAGPACLPFSDGRRAGPFAYRHHCIDPPRSTTHTLLYIYAPRPFPFKGSHRNARNRMAPTRRRNYKTASLFLSTRLRYLWLRPK